MHGRANELKTDLLEYGSKLIDNSITDEELEAFFNKYNGRDSPHLDVIMKNCFRYLEAGQIYSICKRLIPLEARYNHPIKSVLRNKTPATVCLNEFMRRVGHHEKIYCAFTKFNEIENFMKARINMNFELGCLYALLSDQEELRCVHAKKIGRILVFHAITTPINERAAQQAEPNEIFSITKKAISLFSEKEKHTAYFIKLFNEISWHPANHEMKIIKTKEEVQMEKERFTQEMSCLEDSCAHSFTTWPMSFAKTIKTTAEDELIQRTIFINTLTSLNRELSAPQKKTQMILEKIICMLNAVIEKHPKWIDYEVQQIAKSVFLKAGKCPNMGKHILECEIILRKLNSMICGITYNTKTKCV